MLQHTGLYRLQVTSQVLWSMLCDPTWIFSMFLFFLQPTHTDPEEEVDYFIMPAEKKKEKNMPDPQCKRAVISLKQNKTQHPVQPSRP